jgi:glucose-6-phosphate 1-dehydrogenase
MSIDIVLFGGTGDLTWRKLMPALANAFEHGGIPKDLRVLGVAREARLSKASCRALII